MSYTSTPTTTVALYLDDVAAARATMLIPIVEEHYAQQHLVHPPSPAEVVDERYVYTAAVRVGLNRWTLRPIDTPLASDLGWKPGTGVSSVNVHVCDDDLARATGLANDLVLVLADVLGCACATGLAMMTGSTDIEGPFSP